MTKQAFNGAGKRICILIPTYKRNSSLMRLLLQLQSLTKDYRGQTAYQVIVTDSDRHNPEVGLIKEYCSQYILNEGTGFDDNLLFFYQKHLHLFDYVLSVSDDDLFSFQKLNVLHVIDAAISENHGAILFNHIDFVSNNGQIFLKNKHYSSLELAINDNFLRNYFLRLLPRHAGILYSSNLVLSHLDALPKYRNTLHLYAFPLLVAAGLKQLSFIDLPLVYFNMDEKSTGAWENQGNVFYGLLAFLKALQKDCENTDYEIARQGFMQNYLGNGSWLRRDIESRGCSLPDEKEFLVDLEPNLQDASK